MDLLELELENLMSDAVFLEDEYIMEIDYIYTDENEHLYKYSQECDRLIDDLLNRMITIPE